VSGSPPACWRDAGARLRCLYAARAAGRVWFVIPAATLPLPCRAHLPASTHHAALHALHTCRAPTPRCGPFLPPSSLLPTCTLCRCAVLPAAVRRRRWERRCCEEEFSSASSLHVTLLCLPAIPVWSQNLCLLHRLPLKHTSHSQRQLGLCMVLCRRRCVDSFCGHFLHNAAGAFCGSSSFDVAVGCCSRAVRRMFLAGTRRVRVALFSGTFPRGAAHATPFAARACCPPSVVLLLMVGVAVGRLSFWWAFSSACLLFADDGALGGILHAFYHTAAACLLQRGTGTKC